ncbi:hypothetical protein [Nostoc sp. FACHB-190]|uniref:hypothetical protein n=1 Tax=Nostoc sp. FACHB-190 TaxID=2692838 RepID=UPI00168778E9|nr:hypothetical protein [Nostoc sp. FACHB-190]MBD2302299.1 hypothetical protein [Nostoc sp. FACHB-190]
MFHLNYRAQIFSEIEALYNILKATNFSSYYADLSTNHLVDWANKQLSRATRLVGLVVRHGLSDDAVTANIKKTVQLLNQISCQLSYYLPTLAQKADELNQAAMKLLKYGDSVQLELFDVGQFVSEDSTPVLPNIVAWFKRNAAQWVHEAVDKYHRQSSVNYQQLELNLSVSLKSEEIIQVAISDKLLVSLETLTLRVARKVCRDLHLPQKIGGKDCSLKELKTAIRAKIQNQFEEVESVFRQLALA